MYAAWGVRMCVAQQVDKELNVWCIVFAVNRRNDRSTSPTWQPQRASSLAHPLIRSSGWHEKVEGREKKKYLREKQFCSSSL